MTVAVVLVMDACVGRDQHFMLLAFPPRHQHIYTLILCGAQNTCWLNHLLHVYVFTCNTRDSSGINLKSEAPGIRLGVKYISYYFNYKYKY